MLRFTDEELVLTMKATGATINETTSADKAHRPAVIVLKHAEKVTQPAPAQTNVNKVAYRRERAGKPRRKNDEHDFQVRLIACCRAIGATGAAHDLGLDVLLTLLHAIPNGGKRDKITAAITACKIGPFSGLEIDLEAARRAIVSLWIAREILVSLYPTAGQPLRHHRARVRQQAAVQRLKIDAFTRHRWPPCPSVWHLPLCAHGPPRTASGQRRRSGVDEFLRPPRWRGSARTCETRNCEPPGRLQQNWRGALPS